MHPELMLQYFALAAIFAALFILTLPLVAGAPPSPRLGLRGMRRQRYLAENEKFAMIDPMVRWLGARINGLVDDKLRASLDKKLTLAGDPLGLVPEELVALCVMSGFLGIFGGLLANEVAHVGFPIVAACAIIGAMLPTSALTEAMATRYKAINRGLPHAIDLLALAMGAGLDFPAAVRQIVEKLSGSKNDPLGAELTLLLQGLELGQTRAQVLRRFGERVPTDPVKDFVGAVVQAEERGNPVVPVLRIQADVSRQRRSVMAEEAATKAGVALVAPLILIFLSAVLLILGPTMLKLKSGLS
jgi:tight adherence protein C